MSKQDVMKMQTFVLRVNIQCHCDGCKSRIKKLLQKTDGVYTTQVNTEQGKVTVTGNVDPMKLIKKLEKSGKHAEIWGGGGGGGKGSNNFQNMVNNQFKNMQMESGKGGKGGGGGKGGHPQQQQLQQQHHQILQQQQFKGMPKDFKMPPQSKDMKSVKFNLQGQHQQQQHHNNKHGGFDDGLDDDDDDFDDDMDDDFDDDDDEDGDFDDEDEEFGNGHGGQAQVPNKMVMPNKMMGMMGNGHGGPMGMMNMDVLKGGGGGNGKKGGGGGEFEMAMGKKGGHFEKGKGDSGGKKGGGDSDGKNGKKNKGGQKQDGSKDKGHKGEKTQTKSKSKGGMIGGLFGFGCKSTKEKKSIDRKGVNLSEFQDFGSTKKSKGKNGGGGGDGTKKGAAANHHQSNGAKKGGGKQDGAHDFKQMKGFGEMGGGNSYGGGARNMGQQMGSMTAVQGLPTAMNNGGGGYYNPYQGMGQQGNPYGQAPHQHQQQQQQYMEMMMNQHRQQGNEMYHPMMYSRPYPPVSYMPPPPMPGPHGSEPYSNFLSDENANSCSIM
ncbi:unnamed protein product [Linum trigynum]|uniref:HMA domain-containing protein n=1 Tax=Linum trigynum TaxID=586398 RepID=A0AAV2F680_9ROSI